MLFVKIGHYLVVVEQRFSMSRLEERKNVNSMEKRKLVAIPKRIIPNFGFTDRTNADGAVENNVGKKQSKVVAKKGGLVQNTGRSSVGCT
mmetsp:Transcript_8650/g.12814  ORF Transcript_8650/g.12814 Transcript_8650/m.12814 type:complete len:90 (+) Transcript_8650:403-672(+)